MYHFDSLGLLQALGENTLERELQSVISLLICAISDLVLRALYAVPCSRFVEHWSLFFLGELCMCEGEGEGKGAMALFLAGGRETWITCM